MYVLLLGIVIGATTPESIESNFRATIAEQQELFVSLRDGARLEQWSPSELIEILYNNKVPHVDDTSSVDKILLRTFSEWHVDAAQDAWIALSELHDKIAFRLRLNDRLEESQANDYRTWCEASDALHSHQQRLILFLDGLRSAYNIIPGSNLVISTLDQRQEFLISALYRSLRDLKGAPVEWITESGMTRVEILSGFVLFENRMMSALKEEEARLDREHETLESVSNGLRSHRIRHSDDIRQIGLVWDRIEQTQFDMSGCASRSRIDLFYPSFIMLHR